jgi:hypothetical protein
MFVRVLPLMAAGEAAAFDMGRVKPGFKKIFGTNRASACGI